MRLNRETTVTSMHIPTQPERGWHIDLDAGTATFQQNISPDQRPPYTAPKHYNERVSSFRDRVARNIMPPLGNGFKFVSDTQHPGEHIPAQEYTAYFNNGMIPIAALGHKHHDHDCTHGPNYQTLFSNTRFANLVRTAARNALIQGRAEEFTDAMDQMGDAMIILERSDEGYYHSAERSTIGATLAAERHLERLLDLGGELGKEGTLKTLRKSLGLDYYAASAGRH